MKWNKNYTKILVVVAMLALLVSVMSVTAFAASGDVLSSRSILITAHHLT